MIKTGDLVVVVKPTVCCGNDSAVGKIFQVGKIESMVGQCVHCGSVAQDFGAEVADEPTRLFRASRLKKIDPLPQDETTKYEETIHA